MITSRIKINYLKKYIQKLIIDEQIRQEILSTIDLFYNNCGIKIIDKETLYGKINNKGKIDYLEIRYNNDEFICNYTNKKYNTLISIKQSRLKNDSYKITKQENTEYSSLFYNEKDESLIKRSDKVYNNKKELLYQSDLFRNNEVNSIKNINGHHTDLFKSTLNTQEKWYIGDKTIVKHLVYNNENIKEKYYIIDNSNTNLNSSKKLTINLDKDLFYLLINGKLTIEDIINKHTENKQKKYTIN